MRSRAAAAPVLTVTDDPERWRQALRRSGQPVTPFQSFPWLTLAARMTGTTFTPLVVQVGGADVGTATWLARTLGSIRTVNRVPFPYVGPLVPGGLLPETLLALRRRGVAHRVAMAQYQLSPAMATSSHLPTGFTQRMDQTFVVDTSRDEATLWSRLASSYRNKVRQTERRGIEVATPAAPQPVLRRVVDAVFERAGFPSGYGAHFPPALAELQRDGLDAHWTVASRDGVELGSVVTLLYEGAAVGWVGGVLPEHRSTHANVRLYWDAITWAARQGARTLDMVGVPDSSIGTFKRQFGGVLHEYAVYSRAVPGVERIWEMRRYPAAWADRLLPGRRGVPALVRSLTEPV